jgi:hypothetical protein
MIGPTGDQFMGMKSVSSRDTQQSFPSLKAQADCREASNGASMGAIFGLKKFARQNIISLNYKADGLVKRER